MNLLLIGSAFLGAAAFGPGPEAPKAPVETVAETTTSAPATREPRQKSTPGTAPSQKTAAVRPGEFPDRGWMTREINVDQKTGQTTEINVIGFAD
jgi:hypothetical protein